MQKELSTVSSPNPWAPRRLAMMAVAVLGALLQACATTGPATDDLETRSKDRWEAILAGNYQAAYGYLSPGYRSTMSPVDYEISLRTRRVAWTAAEYREHRCEGERCTVDVMVKYKVARPAPGVEEFNLQSLHHESWVRIDGEWWFLPED